MVTENCPGKERCSERDERHGLQKFAKVLFRMRGREWHATMARSRRKQTRRLPHRFDSVRLIAQHGVLVAGKITGSVIKWSPEKPRAFGMRPVNRE